MVDKRKGLIGRHVIRLTPELVRQFYDCARAGIPIRAAAAQMGFDASTFFTKVKNYPEAAKAWERGNAELIAATGKTLVTAADDGNLKAAMFMYEKACQRLEKFDEATPKLGEGDEVREVIFRHTKRAGRPNAEDDHD